MEEKKQAGAYRVGRVQDVAACISSMARQMSLLLLLLLLHLQPHQSVQHVLKYLIPRTGSLTTEEGYNMFYMGENLTLVCQKDSDFDGTVRFKNGNEYEPESSVDLINSTYARMVKLITKENAKKPSYQYQCVDGRDKETLVDLEHISVDYRPRNATNVQVVWQNKTELLIDLDFGGIHYRHAKVVAAWRTQGHNESDWRNCTRLKHNKVSCDVSGVNSLTDNATLLVRVGVTNQMRRDSAIHVFPGIELVDHAKSLPVSSVRVRSLGPRSVEVSVSAVQPELNYTIVYNSIGHSLGHGDSGVKVTGMTESKSWEIAGLHPYYRYRFEVRARFEKGFTSDPSNTVHRMPEDVPESGPIIAPAAYHLDESSCSLSNKATPYIYFQEIPPEDRNGIIQHYTARVKEFSIATTVRRNEPRTMKLDPVPCGVDFVIKIRGSTDVGESPSTSLSVFSGHQAAEVNNIVEKLKLMLRVVSSQGDVRAEWTPPPQPSSANFSMFLFYCNSGDNKKICQNTIQYIEVNASDGQHALQGATADIVGAAVLMPDGLTSGIHFTDCIYNPSARAGEPPKDLREYQLRDHIEVNWFGKTCDRKARVVILNYLLEVCQWPDRAVCQNYTIEANHFSYTVKEVEMNKEYRLRLWAVTTSEPDSLTSSSSVQVRMDPGLESVPVSTEIIVGIILMVLILVIGLGIICFCLCRDKFRSAEYKFKPSIPDDQHFRTGAQITGDESHQASPRTPPAVDDLRNASSDQSRTKGGSITGDHAPEVTDVAHGASSLSNTQADPPAKKNAFCSSGMDVPLVVFSALRQEPAVNLDLSTIKEDVDDDDDGMVKDASGKDPVSDVVLTSVGNRGYMRCSLVEKPSSQTDGKQTENPRFCSQDGGGDVAVPLSDLVNHAGRLGGEGDGGMNRTDPGFVSCPSSWDDLSVSDDLSSLGGVLDGHSLCAVEVMQEADDKEGGRDQHTVESDARMAVVGRGDEEDDRKEEEEAMEENRTPEAHGIGSLPLQQDRLQPLSPVESLQDQQGRQQDTETKSSPYMTLPNGPSLPQASPMAKADQNESGEEEDLEAFEDDDDDDDEDSENWAGISNLPQQTSPGSPQLGASISLAYCSSFPNSPQESCGAQGPVFRTTSKEMLSSERQPFPDKGDVSEMQSTSSPAQPPADNTNRITQSPQTGENCTAGGGGISLTQQNADDLAAPLESFNPKWTDNGSTALSNDGISTSGAEIAGTAAVGVDEAEREGECEIQEADALKSPEVELSSGDVGMNNPTA